MPNSARTPLPTFPTWVPREPKGPRRLHVQQALRNEHFRISVVRAALFPEQFSVKQVAEHPINVLTLQDTERAQLLEGPKISVIGDGNVIIRKGVPTRALMASASKVHDLLTMKPLATQFRVHGKLDHKSISILLDLFTTDKLVQASAVTLTRGGFVKDVLMYQACLSLGIVHHHTKPLLDALRAEVTTRLLATEELNTIINRVPPTDPLFKHLANNLCHRRFRKEIPNITNFEKWLGIRKTLQRAMVEIDQQHKKRREAVNVRNCSWRLDSELKKWGKDLEEAE